LEDNCNEAIATVESELKFQRKRFHERRSSKMLEYNKKLSPAPENKRKTILFNTSIELPPSIEFQSRRGRSTSIVSNSEKVIKRKNVLLKTMSNFTKKHSVSDIFNDYFKKFHFLFFQNFCEIQCNEAMTKISENHKKKLNNYIYYEDQIKELELILTGDGGRFLLILDNMEQRTIIDNMVQAITLDRNIQTMEIEKEFSGLLPNYKENLSLVSKSEKWSQINEEFLNSFVEMLK
jgi:hypothetical protein